MDGSLTVMATLLDFHEARCKLDTPIPALALRHRSNMTCNGEGQTWRDTVHLELRSPQMLVVTSQGQVFDYRRCDGS